MKDKEKKIVEITQKAVRKSEDKEGAFADLLNQEISFGTAVAEIRICHIFAHNEWVRYQSHKRKLLKLLQS